MEDTDDAKKRPFTVLLAIRRHMVLFGIEASAIWPLLMMNVMEYYNQPGFYVLLTFFHGFLVLL